MHDAKYFCDLTALNSEERKRYREFESLLPNKIKSMSEQDNGYTLSFSMTPENFTLVAEFITYESRCCPFLSFSLNTASGEQMSTLRITGELDAKPFIAAELGLLR